MELSIKDKKVEIAVKAALKGGNLAKNNLKDVKKYTKKDGSIVTENDRKAEKKIRNIISEYSNERIIGEEFDKFKRKEQYYDNTYWLIDPIDGTKSYSKNMPFYGTSVSFIEDGSVKVGAFYAPVFDDIYYSVKGKGVYKNHNEISISNCTQPEEALYGITGKGKSKFIDWVEETNEGVWYTYNCALLSQCYLSNSKSDCLLMAPLAPWDISTGKLFVEEASGSVVNLKTGKEGWENVLEGMAVFGNTELCYNIYERFPEKIIKEIENNYEYNYL